MQKLLDPYLDLNKFTRYYVEKKYAPSIYKIPNKFYPKVNKIELAKLVLHEFNDLILKFLLKKFINFLNINNIIYLFKNKKLKENIIKIYEEIKIRKDALFNNPCEYGVFSGKLGGFLPKKEKCTGCLRCWQEYPKVVKILINEKFLEFEKSLKEFNIKMNDFQTIIKESETGEELVKGMGYKGQFSGSFWDGIWLDMSEIVRPTRDGKEGREYISTLVDIGRKEEKFTKENNKIFTIQIPIFFDYLPNDLNNFNIQKAIAIAANKCSTFAIVSLNYYKKLKEFNNLIPLIRNKEDLKEIKEEKILEIEYSEEFFEIYEKMKDKMIIARIIADEKIEENTLNLAKEKVSAIHIVFNYNGFDFSKNKMNMKQVIKRIHNKLVEEKIRNKISILGSGGIIIAEHVPKAIICGFDCVGINITVHIALQSKFEIKRKKPVIKPRKINVEWASQRLCNLISAWHEQLIEALSAMGKRDVRRLRGDFGRAIFYEEIRKEAFSDIKKCF